MTVTAATTVAQTITVVTTNGSTLNLDGSSFLGIRDGHLFFYADVVTGRTEKTSAVTRSLTGLPLSEVVSVDVENDDLGDTMLALGENGLLTDEGKVDASLFE